MIPKQDERVRQVAVAVAILIPLMIVVPSLLLGWRFMPGLLGEWVGTFMGVLTTPFIMEASFATLGLITVITINHWRQKKDGDEFVDLESLAAKSGQSPEKIEVSATRSSAWESSSSGHLD